MRTVVIVFGLVCLMGAIRAQSVGIGTSNPDPTARLDVSDTQRGILIPRLTTQERNAIAPPPPPLPAPSSSTIPTATSISTTSPAQGG
jgi:hypothetical protein